MEFQHTPVFFRQAVDALAIKEDGIYVDCTAGGGGHAAAIAERLTSGRLLAVDRDPQAVAILTERLGGFAAATVVHDNYAHIQTILKDHGCAGADGILADLGVSSHQLDTPERGFSFHNDAPLDMRMSMDGPSAADIVNTWPQAALRKLLFDYGEERYAPAIAARIVLARQTKHIETTLELVDIIKSAIPAAARREGGHPARRTFQALRIQVNGELEKLDDALQAMFASLNEGGRLVIITFHSLEDRIVKKRFAALCTGCTCPPAFPVCVCGARPLAHLPFKALKPSAQEIEDNPRCRSARLRVLEKNGKEPEHG